MMDIRSDQYDKKHDEAVYQYEKALLENYNDIAFQVAMMANVVRLGDKAFTFKANPQLKARIEKLIKRLNERIYVLILSGIKTEWDLANGKNTALVKEFLGDKAKLSEYKRYFNNHESAKQAFLNRKSKGLNLSERVWKYTETFKNELEMALDLGIREGKSAARIARDIKQYLVEPNQLFRRYRNQHGQLELSKRAKTYSPGQGVYRSSYKNALRLASNEINIAYRTAQYERIQDLDFVVGVEIKLSNNHPVPDICDTLNGVYPKTFKWVGWHPFCRCRMETILQPMDEFLSGEKPLSVEGLPDNFNLWVNTNKDRIKRTKNLPYFLRDNKSSIPQI